MHRSSKKILGAFEKMQFLSFLCTFCQTIKLVLDQSVWNFGSIPKIFRTSYYMICFISTDCCRVGGPHIMCRFDPKRQFLPKQTFGFLWPSTGVVSSKNMLQYVRTSAGFPTRPYLACSNTPKHGKYSIWGAYFSALNVIEWGIPEKILQNAVQSHWF